MLSFVINGLVVVILIGTVVLALAYVLDEVRSV